MIGYTPSDERAVDTFYIDAGFVPVPAYVPPRTASNYHRSPLSSAGVERGPMIWRNAVPWRLIPWLAAVAGMSLVVGWQLIGASR